MDRDLDFSVAPWIKGPDLPDPNGPVAVPCALYDDTWPDRPLIDVIGEIAQRLPEQVALDDGAVQLTYRQLYVMACRISHGISQANLPPGPIGVKAPDNAFYVAAMLGCLAAGRACLLMSEDNPPDYNQRLLATSGVQALLVDEAKRGSETDTNGPRAIAIEQILRTAVGAEGPAGRLAPDEPAFLLSTSGSTGVPKVIVRSQRSIQSKVRYDIDAGHYSENDRVVIVAPPATGAGVSWRFVALLSGAALHIVDVPRVGIGGVLRTLRESRITSMRATVSFIKTLSQVHDALAHLATLRLVWAGGEMMLQQDLRQIRALLPTDCILGHSFNMTETAVAKWFVPAIDGHDPVRVAAGYLSPGTEALVLDEIGQPCPLGDIGELVVRTSSAALGEWIDGHLVPDRFERDARDPSKGIYRTGDMVRIGLDGVMVVQGRKDRMFKIRGQRVEPAVIETAMRDVAGVANAAVVAKSVDGAYRIHGFVVPKARKAGGTSAGDAALPAVVREALKMTLPAYMWPYDVQIVDALPIARSGKLDSAALLKLVPEVGSVRENTIPAPVVQGAASRQARGWVADAWRMAFGADKNPSLGFDTAGGDSLQFMQIIFRLEQLSGISLPLDAFGTAMNQEDMSRGLDRCLRGEFDMQAQYKQVFLLPGLGGDEPRLLHFRAGCASEISLICLGYGSWAEWAERDSVIERIIERVVARIQELAPTGPLCLAGYSLGGRIALGAAVQLQAAGRDIERLLILDSYAVVPMNCEGAETAALAPTVSLREEYWEFRRAQNWRARTFAMALIVARRLAKPRWAPLLRWIARHRRQVLPGKFGFYLSILIPERLLSSLADDWRRSLAIIPWISAPIVVFKAQQRDDNPERDTTAWQRHSPDVTVISVGGNHFTMFDPPHLVDLCARFTAACTARSNQDIVDSTDERPCDRQSREGRVRSSMR